MSDIWLLGLVAEPLFLLGVFGASNTIGIRREPERVVLTSIDGLVFATGLEIAAGSSLLVSGLGPALGAPWLVSPIACAAFFVLAFGCRVRVVVGPCRSECVRTFLWIVPWRRHRFERPVAWLDGWGDMSDPEAFNIGGANGGPPGRGGGSGIDEDGKFSLELAWVSREGTDRVEGLVRDFNQAVRELC